MAKPPAGCAWCRDSWHNEIVKTGDETSRPGTTVTPIGARRRQAVIDATARCLALAGRELDCEFVLPPVRFDLKGCAAGMYRVRGETGEIRYNPWLFARDFSGHLATTVPHEAAHYIVDMLHGLRRTRPHGREWRRIMHLLGAEARATGGYDLDGVPVRRLRRFDYACACGRHSLTSIRHRRIQDRRRRYYCRRCGGELVYAGAPGAAPGPA